jgi:hypothetical protein
MLKNIKILKKSSGLIILFIFFVILAINLSYSRNNQTKENHSQDIIKRYTIEQADTGNVICVSFKNESEKSVNFNFSINDKFWFAPQDMINYIAESETDSLPDTNILISKAFNFVINQTSHHAEYTLPRMYEYSPAVLINSFGLGICANRNAVLAHILKEMGFNSRCVHLGGHLVSEVYDNDKWKMLDADNDSYFLKNEKIASFEEIQSNINDCKLIIGANNYNFIHYFFPKTYMQFFTTKEDNEIQNWYMQDVYWKNEHLTLPAGSRFQFPVHNPNSNNFDAYAYGRLSIKNTYYKNINIPFVVHSISGDGVLFNPFYGWISKKSSNHFIIPGIFTVTADSLDIYVYINPHLIKKNSTNDDIKVQYNVSEGIALKTEVHTDFIPNLPHAIFKNHNNFIKKTRKKYKPILMELPDCHYNVIEIDSKIEIYSLLSAFYKDINNKNPLPDSIKMKLDNFYEFTAKNQIDMTQLYPYLKIPSFRNSFFIMIIEFPEALIYDIFTSQSAHFN